VRRRDEGIDDLRGKPMRRWYRSLTAVALSYSMRSIGVCNYLSFRESKNETVR